MTDCQWEQLEHCHAFKSIPICVGIAAQLPSISVAGMYHAEQWTTPACSPLQHLGGEKVLHLYGSLRMAKAATAIRKRVRKSHELSSIT